MRGTVRLTPRLQAVAEQIEPGARVADIGTDHARLPVWLVQNGVSPRCFAADVREGPLLRAREAIAAAGLTREIEAVLSDGLQCVPLAEVDAVVFAGMGGELIASLLAACPEARDPRLRFVFQPMTGAPELRRCLAASGFLLETERLVQEGEKLYLIQRARYTGSAYELSELAAATGLLPASGDPLWPLFARRLTDALRTRRDGLRRGGRLEQAHACGRLLEELFCLEGSPMPNIQELMDVLEAAVPLRHALADDNAGLLCGDRTRETDCVVVTLDITQEAIETAAAEGAGLIVSHHPLIFRPLSAVTADSDAGRKLLRLAEHRIAALCLHTNADIAPGGLADVDAALLGLSDTRVLTPTKTEPYYRFVVFAPYVVRNRLLEALTAAGAGAYGNYAGCAFETLGRGTFLPLEGAQPYIGTAGRREWADELRLEMIVPESKREAVVRAMRAIHPYEEPAFDLLATEEPRGVYGLGRLGRLPQALEPEALARRVKDAFGCAAVRMKSAGKPVRTVAVLPGSGGGHIADAVRAGADALVTGDVRHHQFIEAAEAGFTLIDAGHDGTELPVCTYFAQLLREHFPRLRVVMADPADVRPEFVF